MLAVVLILYGAEDLYNTYVQSTGKLFWVMLVAGTCSTGMVCMDSQKAECKVFLKSDHKIKEKGRCRQKELHLSYFHLAEKFVTIKVLHGRENVMGIKENVMRKMKCQKIPIRFRMEPY